MLKNKDWISWSFYPFTPFKINFIIFFLIMITWINLNCSLKWTFFSCFLLWKHNFKEYSILWFYNSIKTYILNTWLVCNKLICITIICISDKYIIHNFKSYLDLFRIMYCYLCKTPSHFEVFIGRFSIFS
jgi:hypothetical protein